MDREGASSDVNDNPADYPAGIVEPGKRIGSDACNFHLSDARNPLERERLNSASVHHSSFLSSCL